MRLSIVCRLAAISCLVHGLAHPVPAILSAAPHRPCGNAVFFSEALELEGATGTHDLFASVQPTVELREEIVGTRSHHPLASLVSPRGIAFAHELHGYLEAIDFDGINYLLRGPQGIRDYEMDPYPMARVTDVREAFEVLLERHYLPSRMYEGMRAGLAMDFFVFNLPLTDQETAILFGPNSGLPTQGIQTGLFLKLSDGRLRMNGLSLYSRRIPQGNLVHTIYGFADTPEHYTTALAPTEVYVNRDSYDLLKRIVKVPSANGVGAEIGSGSGIQLNAMAKLFPGLDLILGAEIDERARPVSAFNVALNGEEKRIEIVADAEALKARLNGRKIGLAVLNPPFIGMPKELPVPPDQAHLLLPHISLPEGSDRLPIDRMYAKSGWGGTDGLFFTRQFVHSLLPDMELEAPLLVYSQFAVGFSGTIKLIEELASLPWVRVNFEPEQDYEDHFLDNGSLWLRNIQASFTIEEVAELDAEMIIGRLWEHVRDPVWWHQLNALSRPWAKYIFDQFRQEQITHFHAGIVTISRTA